MSSVRTIVLGLMFGLSLPVLAQAQNEQPRGDGDARDTPRAANTARSGRTMPPSRDGAPSTTGSTDQNKGSKGPDLPGICIGCGAK